MSHFVSPRSCDLGAFPLLALGLFVFGWSSCVNNAFSRWREGSRISRHYRSRKSDGFIRAMRNWRINPPTLRRIRPSNFFSRSSFAGATHILGGTMHEADPGIAGGLVLAGCAPKPAPEIRWQAFDGNRAVCECTEVGELWPRPSGKPALASARHI